MCVGRGVYKKEEKTHKPAQAPFAVGITPAEAKSSPARVAQGRERRQKLLTHTTHHTHRHFPKCPKRPPLKPPLGWSPPIILKALNLMACVWRQTSAKLLKLRVFFFYTTLSLYICLSTLLAFQSQGEKCSQAHTARPHVYFACEYLLFFSFNFMLLKIYILALQGGWIICYIMRHMAG